MAQNPRFGMQTGPVPVARGYQPVEDRGSIPASPKAVLGADVAADHNGPWIAQPKRGPDRPVAPHDSSSGIDKAARSLTRLPASSHGGTAPINIAIGSGKAPQRAK